MKSLSELGPYKITLDESWKALTLGQKLAEEKIFYELIPTKANGFIYLYRNQKPRLFRLYLPHVRNVRNNYATIPGCQIEILDGESTVTFPESVFKQVAEMAGARKKRSLSESHRLALLAGRKRW